MDIHENVKIRDFQMLQETTADDHEEISETARCDSRHWEPPSHDEVRHQMATRKELLRIVAMCLSRREPPWTNMFTRRTKAL